MSIKPKYKEMKTKIIYTIAFLMIAKLAYSQEEQYSADKFVAKCPNEIFIGAILEANSINQDTYKFLKISMNPINMGYTIPIKSQTITPSYNNMMKAIHEALKTNDVLKSNYSFSFVIKKIKSYQELAVNWGQNINLQQLLGITPDYKPQKNIILIDINQSFFSIIMDMPESLSTDPQVLQQLDKLAFINSIQFGRKVILVIESNIDYDKLQEAIDNLLKSKEVSQKELAILANSNIRLMTIGNKGIKDINPDNPFTSILTYLSSTVTPDDFGGPISFSASNIKDNSVFVNYFNVQ